GKSLAIGMLSSNMGTYQNALPIECFHLTTASGSNGFLKVLQLKVTATKWNYTGISFMFHKGAGNALFTRATIIVNGGDTTDPTPQIVLSSNPGIDPIYIQKSAANTWDVYIAKVGGEQVGLYDLNVYRPNLITVSTQNQWVGSVPSGYITSKWEHLDTVYPVGSVKLTWDAVNPGTRLGGTWVQFSQGRVLLGQGTGSDGSTSQTFGAGATGGRYTSDQINTTNPALSGFPPNGANYADRCIVRKQAAGYNQERDAMISLVQPYQVIYAWRRTA
uniref:phage baseplate protein n=1 Tax=Faecalibaculum rodentium TaxID=1702221 RepID=UPI0023F1D727